MAEHLGKDLTTSATGDKDAGAPTIAAQPPDRPATSGGTKRPMAARDEDQDAGYDSGEHRNKKLKSSSDAAAVNMEQGDKSDDENGGVDEEESDPSSSATSGHRVYFWDSTSAWETKWRQIVELGVAINNQKHEVGAGIMELDDLTLDYDALWDMMDFNVMAKEEKEKLDKKIDEQCDKVEAMKDQKRRGADMLERLIKEYVSVVIDDSDF